MICLNPPTLNDLTLNDYLFILATADDKKNRNSLQAVSGKSYEFMAENDSRKYEQFVYRGLVALHFKSCLDTHNDNVDKFNRKKVIP